MDPQTGRYRLGLASNLPSKKPGASGGNDTIADSELEWGGLLCITIYYILFNQAPLKSLEKTKKHYKNDFLHIKNTSLGQIVNFRRFLFPKKR